MFRKIWYASEESSSNLSKSSSINILDFDIWADNFMIRWDRISAERILILGGGCQMIYWKRFCRGIFLLFSFSLLFEKVISHGFFKFSVILLFQELLAFTLHSY